MVTTKGKRGKERCRLFLKKKDYMGLLFKKNNTTIMGRRVSLFYSTPYTPSS